MAIKNKKFSFKILVYVILYALASIPLMWFWTYLESFLKITKSFEYILITIYLLVPLIIIERRSKIKISNKRKIS